MLKQNEWELEKNHPITPSKLTNMLLLETKKIAQEYEHRISMIGYVTGCKPFQGGIRFKLSDDDNGNFDCTVWSSYGFDPIQIETYENSTCIITGHLKSEYFHGHRFKFIVTEIDKQTNDSKFKKLKKECESKGYFLNKKGLAWNKITNIGVISKRGSEGYIDFIEQLCVPLNINLEEISLEGGKTSKECIKAIKKLQDSDLIMIMRGGGDISGISSSFDKIELFDAIKKSNIPIITAIGHEADKDDKLLITQVSDFDYSTPSTAAYAITNIMLDPIKKKLDIVLDEIKDAFEIIIEKKKNKLYCTLKCLILQYMKEKFGGSIYCIEEDEKVLIIQKEDRFYKNIINFTDEKIFTEKDINCRKAISTGLEDNDIETIEKNFNDINAKTTDLSDSIKDTIKSIKNLEKLETKFKNTKAKQIKKYYCKKLPIFQDSNANILINIKSIILWYIDILEKQEKEDIDHIWKTIQSF